MMQQQAEILWNENLGPDYYRMGLKCSAPLTRAVPGQFVMLRVSDACDCLLRRPFSIHGKVSSAGEANGIELLYKVVGKGTRRLAALSPGETVDLIGPLGNGFTLLDSHQRIYIVSGGIGVAPLRFLAQAINAKGAVDRSVTVFLGGRSSDDLLCMDEFREMGMEVIVTTDDGSSGDQCLITDPFEERMSRTLPDMIYVCGPMAMLKCTAGIVQKHAVPCEVSVEAHMACGIGACLGCVMETTDDDERYRHVCIDGPVFDIRQLKI